MSFHEKYIKNNNKLKEKDYNKMLNIRIKTTKDSKLDARQMLILEPIVDFFSNQRNMYILINILSGNSIISLRLIEYFVVNYVLKNKLKYNKQYYENEKTFLINNLIYTSSKKKKIKINNNYDNIFLVHDNYKSQLKQYNKKNFDPFCRSKRIKLFYDISNKDKHYFDTTVAQLNFFKWAISNYILDYILDNFNTIEKAMTSYERKIKNEKKTKKTDIKRTKTNFVKLNKTTMKLNCPRIIKFD